MAALAIIWDQAKISFENARICGHSWYRWARFNTSDQEVSSGGKWKKVKGPHLLCLENLFLHSTPQTTLNHNASQIAAFCENNDQRLITNKSYREFIYGGIEFEDNGNNSCNN